MKTDVQTEIRTYRHCTYQNSDHYRVIQFIVTRKYITVSRITCRGLPPQMGVWDWPSGSCIDPQDRPTVTAGSEHCFHACRPFVRPHFSQNKTNFKRKQWSLLVRLLVWPSGSLMTPVLYIYKPTWTISPLRSSLWISQICNSAFMAVGAFFRLIFRNFKSACLARSELLLVSFRYPFP